MIGIIDYGAGNLANVKKAFDFLSFNSFISDDANELSKADSLCLPGVGSFDSGMIGLRNKGLEKLIVSAFNEKKKFLGICLGMQVLFEKSEEGKEEGLKIIKGSVKKISQDVIVPHMGFDKVGDEYYYFVHSYYCECEDSSDAIMTTYYGTKMDVGIQKDSFTAFQFHPEKSGEKGLMLLKKWCES